MYPSMDVLAPTAFAVAISVNLMVYTEKDNHDTNFHLRSEDDVDDAINQIFEYAKVDVADARRQLTCAILVQAYAYEQEALEALGALDTSFSDKLWSRLQEATSVNLVHAKSMIEDLFRMYEARRLLVNVTEATSVIRMILAGCVYPESLVDAWKACREVYNLGQGEAEADLEHTSRITNILKSSTARLLSSI